MRPGRIIALVIGCLLVIPALAMMVAGAALGIGYAFGRGDDGYFDVTIDPLSTTGSAIITEDLDFESDPGSPDWILDLLDADVRLRATTNTEQDIFIGIARTSAVETYLEGVAHDEIIDVNEDLEASVLVHLGTAGIAPPLTEEIWAAQSSGPGTRELDWEATAGSWTAVLMNADGSPGVAAEVNVGAKAAFVLPLALTMVGVGAFLTLGSVALIVVGASSSSKSSTSATPPAGSANRDPMAPINTGQFIGRHPAAVRLEAELDPHVSRWLWLVKWVLAIPHLIVLAFLWVAFAVVTIVAGVTILFTGRYPMRLFEFNVGVMRWSWRVSHYASTGGLGTDEYPAFSLHADPADRTTLEVEYPRHLSRGLVLVKWILAIPHLLIVGFLVGPQLRWSSGSLLGIDLAGGGGLLGLLALVTGVVLLFTDRHPQPLFDLIVGLNRWVYRVIAYVALMTDDYPPFRLDQGGADPTAPLLPPSSSGSDAVGTDQLLTPSTR